VMLQNERSISRFFRMCETRRHVEHPRRNVLAHAFRTLRPAGSGKLRADSAQPDTAAALSWPSFLELMARALVSKHSSHNKMGHRQATQRQARSAMSTLPPSLPRAGSRLVRTVASINVQQRCCTAGSPTRVAVLNSRMPCFPAAGCIRARSLLGAWKLRHWSKAAGTACLSPCAHGCANKLPFSKVQARGGDTIGGREDPGRNMWCTYNDSQSCQPPHGISAASKVHTISPGGLSVLL